jgi:hypothetical protein
MVQESIVDYINAQMKLGVSRDAIKTTLTGAGWVAADVEDTLKKVESAKMAQPMSAMPMSAAASPATASKPMTPAAGSAGGSEPQVIKMSDLVSSAPGITGAPTSAKPATTSSAPQKSPLTGPTMASTATPAGIRTANTFQAASYPGIQPTGSRKTLIIEIILGVIVIAFAAFAGFLFMQNNSLNSQLTSLNGQSSGVTSQLSALQAQVAASTTALTAQVATLGANIQELQTELSFYIAPSSTVSGATSTAMISGVVSGGGKLPYVITATYGAKIPVVNSKIAAVVSALAPLIASAGTANASTTISASSTAATSTPAMVAHPAVVAQFSGTYTPGVDSITLTEVNGVPLP